MPDDDLLAMAQALRQAEAGCGAVEPNPLVGAVVVRDGQFVGAGWHRRYGGPHAEVEALAAAGEAARGATLYVTLEPCCHHGKTPPCTDAILRAGIRRVVVATTDPFPEVAGRGIDILRKAGVFVEIGLLEAEARRLNAPYFKLLAEKRPYVHLKWAMTLDGKIATRTGDSRWVSDEAARRIVHDIRGRMDAIVVGIGTALADDPLLTARPPGPRVPTRIVLDGRGRLPPTSQLARTARAVPTLVVTAAGVQAEALTALGVEVLPLPACHGRPSVPALLDELGRRRMTNVLVEGGAAVLGSFLDARQVDAVHVFVSPRLCGGSAAPSAVGGLGVERIADALPLAEWQEVRIEGDLYLYGRVRSSLTGAAPTSASSTPSAR